MTEEAAIEPSAPESGISDTEVLIEVEAVDEMV
jgi:hypothetical protein